jgi:hypothetical protein
MSEHRDQLFPEDPARPPMSAGRFAFWLVAVWIYIPAMLLLEDNTLLVQLTLGLTTFVFLLGLIHRSCVSWKTVGVVLGVATCGEVFMSVVWGCYEYRMGLVPPYVPPGHVIFYAIACETARRRFLVRHEKTVVRAIMTCGWIYAAASLVLWHDVWGFLWWCALAAFVYIWPAPLVIMACIVYTIALEWIGTTIGNWKWIDPVPYLRIPTANPPSGVGLGYAMLDFATILISAAWFPPKPVVTSEA